MMGSCDNCGVEYRPSDSPIDQIAVPFKVGEEEEDEKVFHSSPAISTPGEEKTNDNDDRDKVGLTVTEEEHSYSLSSSKGTKSSQPQHRLIPVAKALAMLFELPPMTSKMLVEKGFLEGSAFLEGITSPKVFFEAWKTPNEEDRHLAFCHDCGQVLTSFFNSFLDFMRILRLGGVLEKKLQSLKEVEVCQIKIEELSCPSDTAIEIEPIINTAQRKRKSRQKSSTSSKKRKTIAVQEDNLKMETDRRTLEDSNDSDMFIGFNGTIGSDDDDITPPDSPISLDFTEGRKSPRPVRASAARNKDWSSYYKDDDDFSEDDETEPQQGTETEAEGDNDGVEVPDPEIQQILDSVHASWEEGKDPVTFCDDDSSDEDYRPDSDLEELIAAAPNNDGSQLRQRRAGGRTNKQTRLVVPCTSSECEVCGQLFVHEFNKKRHQKAIHGMEVEADDVFSCNSCPKVFIKSDYLRRHRRKVHGEYIPYKTKASGGVDLLSLVEENKTFECPVCHILLFKDCLESHVVEHSVENPWKCKECSSTFSKLHDLNQHKNEVHFQRENENDLQKCEVCEVEFRNESYLLQHQTSVHPVCSNLNIEDEPDIRHDDRQTYTCSECGKVYLKQESLREHMISHGIGQTFKCLICGREFTHDSSRKRHMLLHQINGVTFKCSEPYCDKQFSRKDHLMRHLNAIHGVEVTQEEFSATYLKDNLKVDCKGTEVPCPHCKKPVKRERLRHHLVSHTGERRHVCKTCGQKFGLRSTLRTHIQCVHQNLRRYACTYCDRAFKRTNHLKDHLKLHTAADDKPFPCEQCDKTFRREKNLKSHMITHFGGKEYMCHVCGKAFSRADNMKAHVKSVHEGIEIRKKKPSAKEKRKTEKPKKEPETKQLKGRRNTSLKKEKSKQEPLLNADTVINAIVVGNTMDPAVLVTSVENGEMVSDSNGLPLLSTIAETQTADTVPVTTVVMATKKPTRSRKRPRKSTIMQEQEPVTLLNVEDVGSTIQMPPPGTLVALAVDPATGGVISAEALGVEAVQIEEVHGEVMEGTEFDGQRATIVQLTPTGEIYPATTGPFQTTTYYQYTYYHQE